MQSYWVVTVTRHTMAQDPSEPGSLPWWNEKVIYLQRTSGEVLNLPGIIKAVNEAEEMNRINQAREEDYAKNRS